MPSTRPTPRMAFMLRLSRNWRRPDQPAPPPATTAQPPVTANEIADAFHAAGLGVTFPEPIRRDGPGWLVTMQLPWGLPVVSYHGASHFIFGRLGWGEHQPLTHIEHRHRTGTRIVWWIPDEVRSPC